MGGEQCLGTCARGATVICLTVLAIRAQGNPPVSQAPPLKLRTEARVVQIEVAVSDAKGRPVQDLAKPNFRVIDEGKVRPIQIFTFNGGVEPPPLPTANARGGLGTAFSNQNVAPTIVSHATVILLDGVNGWFENFAAARKGVVGLLDKVPPDERIAVYAVARNRHLVVVQDYTSDHAMLLQSVTAYIAPAMEPAPPGMENMASAMRDVADRPPPSRDPTKQGVRERDYLRSQASEDVRAAFDALAPRLAAIPGRKSVFWITQGFPPSELRWGRTAWDQTFRGLNQANVAVNTVDANGMGGPVRLWGPGAILSLQEIAEQTGGTAIFHRNDLDEGMAEINAARASYTLGFYLGEKEGDGRFHRLTVKVDRPALELYYRRGYYSGTAPTPDSSQKKAALETALLSPADSSAIGITAEVAATAGKMLVHVKLDLETLTIKQGGSVCTGKVDEMFLLLDASGKQLAKVSDTREFQFPEEARAHYTSEGVALEQTLPLVGGASRLSVIIRDAATGKLGSLTVSLEKAAGPGGK
jgi:VWFA-related protein